MQRRGSQWLEALHLAGLGQEQTTPLPPSFVGLRTLEPLVLPFLGVRSLGGRSRHLIGFNFYY